MIKNTKTLAILIAIFLLLTGSCKEKVITPVLSPIGFLTNYQGCKTFAANLGSVGQSHSPTKECIEYEYDGEGRLTLRHINSGFNCCPEEIDADISVTGNLIFIEEQEKEQGCFCRCLFDLEYEFLELEPGEYTIEVKAPYIEATDQVLIFNVKLFSPCSGTFCVDRTHYPWGDQE
jgi:YD repeat-containing protein